MRPRSSVRLQLHAGFTLDDARARVPYYAALGLSHFYLSPISRAVPGSLHGYDVVDPTRVSAELGGESALLRLSAALRERGMGLIADIVPNHMAAHPDNSWWADVLERGPGSRWARHFDILWRGPDPALRNRVLLPVLPAPYERCLRRGEIALVHENGRYRLIAAGLGYPLALDSVDARLDPEAVLRACRDPRDGWRVLHRILQRQHYRLAWWRTAADRINWRRFFEINGLIALRAERQAVFDDTHALPLRLCAQGVLDGLRIDHVDGLASPGAYLRRLRAALDAAAPSGDRPYLVVEKILAPGERLDSRWPVDGSTGYDFLDEAGALLHDPRAQAPLRRCWVRLDGDARQPGELLARARLRLIDLHFIAERRALTRALLRMLRLAGDSRDWTPAMTERVMRDWLAAFPVYRTYAEDGGPGEQDLAHARVASRQVAGRDERDLLRRILGLVYNQPPHGPLAGLPAVRAARRHALRRLQQLTAPLAAKALEDTHFYRYGPLLSRNEVGASPTRPSLDPAAFHAACAARARTHPRALLATGTHDHKRGEDTRARLAVLSEMPRRWIRLCDGWLADWPPPAGLRRADRYMLLQTLVGAWPLDLSPEWLDDPPQALNGWLERVAEWQLKALREAKLATSWTDPDIALETAARRQLMDLPCRQTGQRLLRELGAFAMELVPAGMINSLAQTLLRGTAPGVPDLYQGADLWDFSLVDPDNRRPVDYALRERLLRTTTASVIADPARWRDGSVKLYLLTVLLGLRRTHGPCFTQGGYSPVPVMGARAAHVVAFVRRIGNQAVLAVAPRLCATRLAAHARASPDHGRAYWRDTCLALPATVWPAAGVRNALDGAVHELGPERRLALARLLETWPVAAAVTDTAA